VIVILTLIIAGILAAAGSGHAQASPSPVDLVRIGCVGSEMNLDGFRRVADEHHWEPLLEVVSSQADIDRIVSNPDWGMGYDTGSGWVTMSGPKALGRVAASCTVKVVEPTGEWDAGVDGLASELGLSPAVLEMRQGVEGGLWSASDGRKLSVSYTLSSRTLEMTLSRPLVPQSQ